MVIDKEQLQENTPSSQSIIDVSNGETVTAETENSNNRNLLSSIVLLYSFIQDSAVTLGNNIFTGIQKFNQGINTNLIKNLNENNQNIIVESGTGKLYHGSEADPNNQYATLSVISGQVAIVNQAVTDSTAQATTATTAATTATAQATTATTAATAATGAATTATISAGNALISETTAQEWATNPEDVVVENGNFSAFHWAQKANTIVNGNSINADNIDSGTLSDNRLTSNVTKSGNSFNGNDQLVQLDSTGRLPALDGSQLIGVDSLPAGGAAFQFLRRNGANNGTEWAYQNFLKQTKFHPVSIEMLIESGVSNNTITTTNDLFIPTAAADSITSLQQLKYTTSTVPGGLVINTTLAGSLMYGRAPFHNAAIYAIKTAHIVYQFEDDDGTLIASQRPQLRFYARRGDGTVVALGSSIVNYGENVEAIDLNDTVVGADVCLFWGVQAGSGGADENKLTVIDLVITGD